MPLAVYLHVHVRPNVQTQENVGESGLTQFLMSEVTKLQRLVKEERRRRQALDDAARQQQVRDHELRKQRERVLRMREERDRLWEKARALKEENYGLLHELTRLSEEKNGAFMSNRDLQLEIEKLKHCLMNAESDSKIHRKRTVNLKNAMEQRPSQDMVWSLQRENDLLTSRIQELENSIQKSTALALNEHDRVSIQELEDYKQHAQAKHQELVNNLYALRRNLQEAEQLRDKYLVEKDVLELKCLTLKKDSKMYRARMEEILKQMDEVIRERDKAIATREEYHQENSRNLQDKDKYRKQIRELGEKCDELQVQLFRTEGEVLALQTKLKNCAHQVSDLEDSSLASSLELKSQTSDEDAKDIVVTGTNENEQSLTPEDYNMCKPFKMNDVATDELSTPYRPRARQDNCKFTYRRKRALRSKTNGTNNSPCALTMCHTSGSDNTDTDDI
ncbi:caspase recruitment domain-containing protein 9-like isoform X2 [Denticeps clupeoides]|uniref:caspase recruitment domain-containing protein 9-like isoform X2 n=1 Tax=Denticeps clupeoides TaxID=299321 RepID=UPI0010A3717D|nr:caspase recruitment domain-containing protein 9-like isoform X2 [Denticeps clupeoides]